jgi:hypothetical protein
MKNPNSIPPETRHDPARTWITNAVCRIGDGTGLTSAAILAAARKRAGTRGSVADALTKWAREVGRPISPPGMSR